MLGQGLVGPCANTVTHSNSIAIESVKFFIVFFLGFEVNKLFIQWFGIKNFKTMEIQWIGTLLVQDRNCGSVLLKGY
jgi:hypothetical protein